MEDNLEDLDFDTPTIPATVEEIVDLSTHAEPVAEHVENTAPKYPKKEFGSGVQKRTEEKQAQCPICKRYYKRVNEAHLKSIHDMTLEDLKVKSPELLPFFTVSGYATENSEYSKLLKAKLEEMNNAKAEQDPITVVEELEDATDSFLDASEKFVSALIEEMELNPEDPNFKETGKRIAKAYKEILSGHFNKEEQSTEQQLAEVFKTSFPSEYNDLVAQSGIKVIGMCPHHLLPVEYNVNIAIMPNRDVIGLSKIARCVEILASRLVLQEDLTKEIADAFEKHLNARGVYVVVDGIHNCMKIRGAEQTHACTHTAAVRGVFARDVYIKSEALEAFKRNKLA